MTLKELKNKLDKLCKAYDEDKLEVMVYTKEDGNGRVFHTPNAIEIRTAINDKGNPVEQVFILKK